MSYARLDADAADPDIEEMEDEMCKVAHLRLVY
jgi:hypothetical protein